MKRNFERLTGSQRNVDMKILGKSAICESDFSFINDDILLSEVNGSPR